VKQTSDRAHEATNYPFKVRLSSFRLFAVHHIQKLEVGDSGFAISNFKMEQRLFVRLAAVDGRFTPHS
jgi:hypothetical protein